MASQARIPNRAYDFTPHAGRADFDDSKWEVIDPTTLDKRRSAGKLAFNWYRLKITVPERIGTFDPTGSTLVFSTSLDDYAEVWVDSEIPRAAGQSGGSVIKGWNAENRLIIGRGVKSGQTIQLAIFGINGPISNPPTNYIYMQYARLEFHQGSRRSHCRRAAGSQRRSDSKRSGHRRHRAGQSEDLQTGRRLSIHRRPDLDEGRLPALQRSQCEYDLQVQHR